MAASQKSATGRPNDESARAGHQTSRSAGGGVSRYPQESLSRGAPPSSAPPGRPSSASRDCCLVLYHSCSRRPRLFTDRRTMAAAGLSEADRVLMGVATDAVT